VDTGFALVLRRVLLAHDLDLNRGDYTLVPLGATAARLTSMLAGQTYAGVLNPPFDVQGQAGGLKFLSDQSAVLPDYPGTVLAVRADWARDNRDLLVRYLGAWRSAGELVDSDPARAAQLFSADAQFPLTQAQRLLPAEFNHGQLNVPGLASVLELRTLFGYQLPMGTDIARYYDEWYWQATVAGK
jgi:ABC-type nitrate/sulfonate/bicarbonate transport system substrate-binding protein